MGVFFGMYLRHYCFVCQYLLESSVTSFQVSATGDVKLTGECIPRSIMPPDRTVDIRTGLCYLPPEVLRGQPYIACADMYAVAIFALEIKLPNFEAFSNLPKFEVEHFLKISARSYYEQNIRALALSEDAIDKLICCLDSNVQIRPDAASLVSVLRSMERSSSSSKSIATPKTIWRTFSSKKM